METEQRTQSQFSPTKEETMEAGQHMRQAAAEAGRTMQQQASDMYGKTRQAVSEAYEKTSRQVSGKYDQLMVYSRENPGKTTLIALGTGLGVGLLLGSVTRPSRPTSSATSRYAQPIVNALSDVAREYFR
jgi:ElaB/YqjD/DUF883 family membrane-anchored ribosome-binding protein